LRAVEAKSMSDKSIAGFLSYAASGTVNSVERYRDTGCDLCAGVPLAPDSQSCDHRCSCGRQLICEAAVEGGK